MFVIYDSIELIKKLMEQCEEIQNISWGISYYRLNEFISVKCSNVVYNLKRQHVDLCSTCWRLSVCVVISF